MYRNNLQTELWDVKCTMVKTLLQLSKFRAKFITKNLPSILQNSSNQNPDLALLVQTLSCHLQDYDGARK